MSNQRYSTTMEQPQLMPRRVERRLIDYHDPITRVIRRSMQAGIRWKIEEDNEQDKQLTGLDQYQIRKVIPWHRGITCTMLTYAFLTFQRALHLDPMPHTRTTSQRAARRRQPSRPREAATTARTRSDDSLTLAVLAVFLALTGLAVRHDDVKLLRQRHWRTERQVTVAISHYQRRGDPLPPYLRPGDPHQSHRQELPL